MSKKVAFVTGASNVTGKAIALEMARAGYNVIGFTYAGNEEGAKKTQAELEALGATAAYYKMDTRNIEESMATLNKFTEEYGALDAMVNNVGITTVWKFLDVTVEDFDWLSEVNIRGTYFMTQAAAKNMVANKKKGFIVNISSVHAIGTFPGSSVYASTRAAVSRMTRSIALELAPYGITVNAFAPGYVDMTTAPKFADPEKKERELAMQKRAARYMPTRRWQKPQEIGECVAFLCSESARFIVGQTIFAEGGVTIPMGSDPNWVNSIGLYDQDEE